VAYLVEFPVDGGGQLVLQASADDLPGGLELAAGPGEIAARASESLEHAFDQFKPAMTAIVRKLRAMTPDEVAVEFGVVLSAETGVVIAKGGAEAHFTVTMSWTRSDQKPGGNGDDPSGSSVHPDAR
jgi:hypothetical protein